MFYLERIIKQDIDAVQQIEREVQKGLPSKSGKEKVVFLLLKRSLSNFCSGSFLLSVIV